MTVKTARKRLRGRLFFGNVKQIEALALLRLLAEFYAIIAKHKDEMVDCERCNGSGHIDCPTCGHYDYDCQDCDGEGEVAVVPWHSEPSGQDTKTTLATSIAAVIERSERVTN
ncbi:hypothetical protein LCGC14_2849730 [marine sediment metagenome]|uniref:Uncharacterized protein n=1 Tax=marine sediment metagenome TaxID=412755 RepID=A0A0F8Y8X4_9ZZZZ